MATQSSRVRRAIRWLGRAAWAAVVTGADLGDRRAEPEPRARRPARSVRRRR